MSAGEMQVIKMLTMARFVFGFALLQGMVFAFGFMNYSLKVRLVCEESSGFAADQPHRTT